MCKGFKQISNDFFESDYWRQSRTYNDCEAVLDIISQVRFEASEHTARIGGREVTWSQAQWPASVRFLAARWKWTEWRVRAFLATLRRRGVIETSDDQGVNMITIKKYLIFREQDESHTPVRTESHTLNELNISEIIESVTQQVTQRLTQRDADSHSTHTNNNNGNNIIDSSLRSESHTHNIAHAKFREWLSQNCPYIFKHYKLLTDNEFAKLKAKYGTNAIAEECANIENRVDLRKKYSNLYRTLLNWLKRRKNETTSTTLNGGRLFADGQSGSPTNEQLVSSTYGLINKARAREDRDDSF